MYDLFNDFIGVLPLRYQFIIPVLFVVFICMILFFIIKLLGGR